MLPMKVTLMEIAILVTAIVNFAAGYLAYYFRTRRKLKKHQQIFNDNLQQVELITELNKKLLQEQQSERLYAAGWKTEAVILRNENARMKELIKSMQEQITKLQKGNK